ncbi:MAG: ABC transporter permease subunit [Myxococcales bacterium]|nr:ABC transporter permease subunit [Myxococcales bacterium]
MSWRRVSAVLWKDLLDLRKNPALLATLAVLPAVLVAVPTLVVYSYVHSSEELALRTIAQHYEPNLPADANAVLFLVQKTVDEWFGLFLIMPVVVPMLISSHSVAGEKERRTLEPLLATPITSAELVLGKSLSALLPAFGVTLVAFAVLCVIVDLTAWPLAGRALLPNANWLFGILAISPLFSFFGNAVAVIISARVGDARLAQQLSGLFVLPLVGLAGLQLAGFVSAGPAYYGLLGGAVLLLDIGLLALSVRLLDRERLISRWS